MVLDFGKGVGKSFVNSQLAGNDDNDCRLACLLLNSFGVQKQTPAYDANYSAIYRCVHAHTMHKMTVDLLEGRRE
jgi:hypothetical protein